MWSLFSNHVKKRSSPKPYPPCGQEPYFLCIQQKIKMEKDRKEMVRYKNSGMPNLCNLGDAQNRYSTLLSMTSVAWQTKWRLPRRQLKHLKLTPQKRGHHMSDLIWNKIWGHFVWISGRSINDVRGYIKPSKKCFTRYPNHLCSVSINQPSERPTDRPVSQLVTLSVSWLLYTLGRYKRGECSQGT